MSGPSNQPVPPQTSRRRSSEAAFAELCRRYGISRKTGYKWLDRYTRLGPESLADRSHRPEACSHATSPAVIREILQLRRAWRWGARKLHQLLLEAHPGRPVSAIPIIHRILVRHGPSAGARGSAPIPVGR